MLDWMQLLTSYWWVLAIIITTVFIALRVNQFFNFFTALVMLLAVAYGATLVFFPPSNILPKDEVSDSQVLGVSDSSESATQSNKKENCLKKIEGHEDLAGCAEEIRQGIKMPDFGKILGEHIEIKYE